MNRPSTKSLTRSFFIRFLPYVVPMVMLGVTFFVWESWNRFNEAGEERRFDDAVSNVIQHISWELNNYKMFSEGAGGVFAASEKVEPKEFRAYFEYRKITALYPGLQALAFADIVAPSERLDVIRRMSVEGISDYAIWPTDGGDSCAPLLYIEPLNALNRRLLGWDMFSQEAIRDAALASRNAAEVRITPRIELPLSPGDDHGASFLIVVPIYAAGLPLHNQAARREAFSGFIVDVVAMDAFIRAIRQPSALDVRYDIYDGSQVSVASLMHAGLDAEGVPPPRFTRTITLEHYNRPWTFRFANTPAFEAAADRWTSKGILAAGTVIAFLFYLLIRQEISVRRRALRLAEYMSAELRESEWRYRLHFENVTDVIFSLDTNLRFIDVSPSVEGLLGYRPQELMGRSFGDRGMLSPDEMERAADACRQLLAGANTDRQEYEFFAKDGRRLVGEVASHLIDDEGGRRIISVARDITERKRIEAANARQRDLLSGINRLLQKTLTADSEAEVARMCLDAAERLTGSAFGWIGETNAQGRLDVIVISDTGWARCRVPDADKTGQGEGWPISGSWGRVLRQGRSQIVNDPAADPDRRGPPGGHPEITSFLGVPLQSEATVSGMIALANKPGGYTDDDRRDVEQLGAVFVQALDRFRANQQVEAYSRHLEQMVAERTAALDQAAEDARSSRDRLDAILQAAADGLIVTDHEGRVMLMNPSAEALLGLHLHDAIGKPIDFSIQDRSLKDRIHMALQERSSGYEFDMEVPDGRSDRRRILRAKTSKIGTAPSPGEDNMVVLISDVTAERELDRMKTEFLSTAAHELRTPLTSIQGFSEILVTRKDLEPERRQRFLECIHNQAVALGNIINDLLDISRIESGRGFTIHKEHFDLRDVIRDAVRLFEDAAQSHRFEVHLPPGPLSVQADRAKLGQVMENLLSNAVKYAPEGGRITISVEPVPGQPGGISLCVEDQGLGMTPDQIERVFDKFWRADATNKAIEGTGLGMSIVKYIVEAHDGTVQVHSRGLGNGTTVTVMLNRTNR